MEAFGLTLLALATVSLLGIFVLQLLGMPFRIDVTRRTDLPAPREPEALMETEQQRKEREEAELKRDVVASLNRYFYGDPHEGGDSR